MKIKQLINQLILVFMIVLDNITEKGIRNPYNKGWLFFKNIYSDSD